MTSTRSARPRAAVRLLGVLAAAAVLAAGCGVSGKETPLAGPRRVGAGAYGGVEGASMLKGAAEATAGAETQKMTMTISMDGAIDGGPVGITADGAFDEAAGRSHVTMDLGDLFGQFGAADFLPDGAGEVETVVDGDVVYLRSALFSQFGDTSKPWVKIDASDLDSVGAVGGGAANDPSSFLEFLQGAGSVDEVGTEEVRGVETTHVKAELEVAKLVADAPEADRERLEEALGSLGAAADSFETIPADAWIDGDGQVRRFTMTFDFAEAGGAAVGEMAALGDGSLTLTVELYDLGEPVDIAIPDPSEVGELGPSILGGGN